ncbi:hypothetical protein QQ045_020965 [Rhodiola kirilowii]
MSETVLAPLVLKLDTLLHTSIHENVRKARDLVETLRGSLRTVDANEECDLEVNGWTSRVRDASYPLEDVIDKFKIHLVSQNNFVRNIVAKVCIEAALKQFQDSVKTIIAARFPVDSDSRGSSKLNIRPSEIKEPTSQPKDELVAIEEHKNNLIELLIAEGSDDLRVIPVVGMGGLGKTTLVKQVYHDAKVRKHFEICIWVHVPRHFNECDVLNNIIQQINSQNKQPKQSHQDQQPKQAAKTNMVSDLKKKLHGHLASTRYVIVLDGVWTISVWHSIKHAVPDNNKLGSRVIMTTRSIDVAYNSCKSVEYIYQLPLLPENDSRILFHEKTFVNGSCPVPLKEVSESILKICCGIPIAILAIAGVLRSKTTLEEWEAVRRSLGSDGETHDDDSTSKSAYHVLLLSYNDLPFHLKACYMYLSIFPEDHLIECARLIHLWVAEGLVEVMDEKTPEDVANVYITELLNRSLLQVADTTSDGRVKACRIPPLLRTIVIMKSREINFVAIGEEHDESWTEEMRRISIHHNLPCITKSQAQQIRSLLTFDVEKPQTIFYRNFKLLTVLDLKGADIVDFPATIVDLFNLRYLSLRETKVESVPKSIGTLQNLETLDLKYTKVAELPKGIVKLQRLRNLLLYSQKAEKYATFNKKVGFRAPKQVGKLKFLQKLCFIDTGADSGSDTTVSELGKLTQLRRLGIVNLRRGQNVELCSSLEKLGNLRALSITCSESEKMEFQDLLPPESLRRLYLIGQLESLPPWFSSLKNLVKIFLKGSMLCFNPLKKLEQLPSLVHIELLEAYNGKDLLFEAGTFHKLRILGLNKLESLHRVTVVETSMPNLEKLVLQDCSLLETVPSGIEHLLNLKVFHLIDMPQKLVDAVDPPPNEGTAYLKVQHIPEVNATSIGVDSVWKTKRLSASLKESRLVKKSQSEVWENKTVSVIRKSSSLDSLPRTKLELM